MSSSTLNRNSSIELLRIICILFILMIHTYGSLPYSNLSILNQLLVHPINIGNFAVSTFILISGYYGIKFKGFRFIQLILLTTLYNIMVHVLNNGLHLDFNFIKACLVIPFYKNWFITCYLFLMLFAPYIDIFFKNIERDKIKHLLIILFIGFSLLPTFFNSAYYTILCGGGKCLIYMIYIYMIGRYIRLYKNENILNRKRVSFTIFLFSSTILCLLNIIIGYLFHKKCLIFAYDCSPFILISSIAIFSFFRSINFYSKFINYIASSVLAVYLLDGMRVLIDKHLINLNQYIKSDLLIIALIIEVTLTFIIAIFIDKIRNLTLGKIEKKFINKILDLQFLYNKSRNKLVSFQNWRID